MLNRINNFKFATIALSTFLATAVGTAHAGTAFYIPLKTRSLTLNDQSRRTPFPRKVFRVYFSLYKALTRERFSDI